LWVFYWVLEEDVFSVELVFDGKEIKSVLETLS